MSDQPNPTEHIRTRQLAPDEAKRHLEAFDAEMKEMVKRYEIHTLIYCAGMGVVSPTSDPDGAVISSGNSYGCLAHGLIFLARFLGYNLQLQQLSQFLHVVSTIAFDRMFAPPATEAVPSDDIPTPPTGKFGPN